ncbi:hypothetical protein YC2023_105879 [Brassica napus]
MSEDFPLFIPLVNLRFYQSNEFEVMLSQKRNRDTCARSIWDHLGRAFSDNRSTCVFHCRIHIRAPLTVKYQKQANEFKKEIEPETLKTPTTSSKVLNQPTSKKCSHNLEISVYKMYLMWLLHLTMFL